MGDRWVTRLGLYDQARNIEPRLKSISEHKLGNFLNDQGCDNSRKVMRRRGWTFPELTKARKTWETRFPGWKWRNPNLKEWQAEVTDDDEDYLVSETNPEGVPF